MHHVFNCQFPITALEFGADDPNAAVAIQWCARSAPGFLRAFGTSQDNQECPDGSCLSPCGSSCEAALAPWCVAWLLLGLSRCRPLNGKSSHAIETVG